MAVFVAAIADDDTGATDLAGMLTEQGMRVILVPEDVTAAQLACWSADCDAIVLGTASRSVARDVAYRRTAAAARLLRQLGPKVLAIKYCSTFDSTAQGNIGPSIDAAMDVTGEEFTIALPALPALGRTTYMGYHFVGKDLLSDSVLRNHPLNPMTNAHLPSHLQSQTSRRVGLLAYPDARGSGAEIAEHLEKLRSDGVQIALLDCIDTDHLERLGQGIADMPLLTGSSAWAMVLPQLWRRRGVWKGPTHGAMPTRQEGGSGVLIVSGSCSQATQIQNAWARGHGIQQVNLDLASVERGDPAQPELIEQVSRILAAGGTCLLSTTGGMSKQEVHRRAEQAGLSHVSASERIGDALAATVVDIFLRIEPKGLIVAGGETSSTLSRRLALGGLQIGPNIEPGVPVCVSLGRPQLGVVLKSGNFGSEDFYSRAMEAIGALPLIAARSMESI